MFAAPMAQACSRRRGAKRMVCSVGSRAKPRELAHAVGEPPVPRVYGTHFTKPPRCNSRSNCFGVGSGVQEISGIQPKVGPGEGDLHLGSPL